VSGVCVCVCVCVCIYLSTYVSIYMLLVLAVPEVPVLESAMCVCVCVYYCSTYEKAVRVGGCSTGVAAQQVLSPEHSGVSLLCKG
jgi:hypothetical protein